MNTAQVSDRRGRTVLVGLVAGFAIALGILVRVLGMEDPRSNEIGALEPPYAPEYTTPTPLALPKVRGTAPSPRRLVRDDSLAQAGVPIPSFAVETGEQKSASIEGFVVDRLGGAVAHAEVRLWLRSLQEIDLHGARPDRTLATENGRFRFEGVGREFVLEARAPGLLGRSRLVGWCAAGGSVRDLTLVVVPSVELSAVVQDDSGRPISKALVRSEESWKVDVDSDAAAADTWHASPAWWKTTTNEAGEFRANVPEEHPVEVVIEAPGFQPTRFTGLAAGAETIELVLRRGVELAGRVRGPSGEAIPGAVVRVTGRNREQATTDSRGAFTFLGLLFDPEAALLVVAEGYSPHWQELGALRSGPPMEIELREGRELRGLVLDPDGRPVEGAEVRRWSAFMDSPRSASRWAWDLPENRGRTDEQGRFRFPNCGWTEIAVHADAPPCGTLTAEEVVAPNVSEVVLRLRAPDLASVRFHGTVLDAETKRPIPFFRVHVRDVRTDLSQGLSREVRTEDGKFELDAPVSGPLEIWIEAPGHAPWHRAPEAYEEEECELRVALDPAQDLTVQLWNADGSPAAGVSTLLQEWDGSALLVSGSLGMVPVRRSTGDDGRARFPGLPRRPLLLRVDGPSLAAQSFSILPSPGTTSERTFLLDEDREEPPRRLAGTAPSREAIDVRSRAARARVLR